MQELLLQRLIVRQRTPPNKKSGLLWKVVFGLVERWLRPSIPVLREAERAESSKCAICVHGANSHIRTVYLMEELIEQERMNMARDDAFAAQENTRSEEHTSELQ